MASAKRYFLDLPDAEIVFGIVAPLGTPMDPIESELRSRLEKHGYEAQTIRLSKFLDEDIDPAALSPARQEALMEKGNELRRDHGDDHLALMAISLIYDARRSRATEATEEFMPRTAHIIRSLKHPEEVLRLRSVYGRGFFLIGISAPSEVRMAELDDQDFDEDEAHKLLAKDAAEPDEHGQQTRDTFELADAFLQINDPRDPCVIAQVHRVVDLLMSYPFHPPTQEEHSMFMAYSSAFRSADLSRQVGAVVVSQAGVVIGTGANEAPAPGGKTWWPTAPEFWKKDVTAGADHERGYDSNERERNKIIARVLRTLVEAVPSEETDDELVTRHSKLLKPTGFLDLTEFGRAVHAEMSAVLNCAKSGSSTLGATLYCTTFPCHNCTKHIIAAGIKQVIYVEPYPKSKAKALHEDSIVLTDEETVEESDERVRYRAFNGIGPRRFVDLFSMSLGSGRPVERKIGDKSGRRVDWEHAVHSAPRLALDPRSYLQREKAAVRTYRDREAKGAKR